MAPPRFWPIAPTVLLADCATKTAATHYLPPEHVAHPLLGNLIRLTLAYDHSATMGLPARRGGLHFHRGGPDPVLELQISPTWVRGSIGLGWLLTLPPACLGPAEPAG